MPAPPDETDAERSARQKRGVRLLSDLALDLAIGYGERAKSEFAAKPDADAKPVRSTNAAEFERYSRVVRQFIPFEAKLAAGFVKPGKADAPAPAAVAPPPDTRREPIREHFRELTTRHPERAKLRRALETAVDALLIEDPEHRRVPAEFIARVAKEFGLPFDVATIPDSLLFHPHQMPKLRYEHERSGRPPPKDEDA